MFLYCLSDIQMPQLDGIELLRHIKKEYKGIDVILIAGYSMTYTFTDVTREDGDTTIAE